MSTDGVGHASKVGRVESVGGGGEGGGGVGGGGGGGGEGGGGGQRSLVVEVPS